MPEAIRKVLASSAADPSEPPLISDESFAKSQAYGLEKCNFGIIESVFEVAMSVASLLALVSVLWGFSLKVISKFGLDSSYEVTQSLVFIFVSMEVNHLLSLPFDLYSTFVIEQRYAFNKTTWKIYLTDELKTLALSVIIGCPVMAAFIHIIKWGGPNFWFYTWVFLFAVSIVMTFIYPLFIMPLFNKLESLPEGPLRTAVEALCSEVHFPLKKLFQMDGSKRSAHSNAFMYGFMKNKRLVLYDTLIKQLSVDEILAVLGHELGHWYHSHIYKNLAVAQLYLLLLLFLFSRFVNSPYLYEALGFHTRPVLIGLTVFMSLYEPIDHAFHLLMNYMSRRLEYQADAFATDLKRDLVPALVKLNKENLSTLVVDPLFSFYHYSHPTLVERIEAINARKQKRQ
eukprot:TRINITY_DN3630_c0_g1_i1.p1 TRINITY_DN3630_c0_g1~~TRINITY_DN3630_c0_g1_i1.p1  ORF type:complete len:437 (-),score=128.43 TRINITY_DN3630_c0_g1_i1:58-1254(-)